MLTAEKKIKKKKINLPVYKKIANVTLKIIRRFNMSKEYK